MNLPLLIQLYNIPGAKPNLAESSFMFKVESRLDMIVLLIRVKVNGIYIPTFIGEAARDGGKNEHWIIMMTDDRGWFQLVALFSTKPDWYLKKNFYKN